MHDSFGRRIHYLRIAVTDRCNLRCLYCMPAAGIPLLSYGELIAFEEILAVVRAAINLGFDKFRLTGGEPLVRQGLVDIVRQLARLPGIGDLSMTTNGILLSQYAQPLREAGLKRLNISLDTLDAARFQRLTRGGELSQVLDGITAALNAGFKQIKINCVVLSPHSQADARAVAAYAQQRGIEARLIPRMDLTKGVYGKVEPGGGGDCQRCNRVRLTSNGWIRPCLFGDQQFSIRRLGPTAALCQAIASKPPAGGQPTSQVFSRIGG